MTMKGSPGSVTPADSKSSPARTWAAYQRDGIDGVTWGSLQSSGRPLAVLAPATTQELLAPPAVGIQRAASANRASAPARGAVVPAARRVSARIVGLASG